MSDQVRNGKLLPHGFHTKSIPLALLGCDEDEPIIAIQQGTGHMISWTGQA